MKKTAILLILLCLTIISRGQLIKGTVFDKDTKEPVIAATVYFNGTSAGTLTDVNGHFSINASKYSSMPLTVSAIGYYSVTIKNFSSSKPIDVYLETKVFELDEVNVTSKFHSLKRSENLTVFRNEFLGTTTNALNCKILNEDDLVFRTSKDGDTLTALASKPLQIENRALGYNITYFLDRFEYNKESKTFVFNGNVIFREDTTLTDRKKKYIDRKREATYLGSRMHFFRSLWINDLNSNGFTVRNTANEIVSYKKIVLVMNSRTKYLSTYAPLGISYYSKKATSYLVPVKDKIFFDADGYYDQLAVIWEGEMSRQRIADQLPFEYRVE
jgi:hypothetical protein